jgi:hypothetical protein
MQTSKSDVNRLTCCFGDGEERRAPRRSAPQPQPIHRTTITPHTTLTADSRNPVLLSCNSLETINRLQTHLEALNGLYRRGDRNPTSDPRNVRGAS